MSGCRTAANVRWASSCTSIVVVARPLLAIAVVLGLAPDAYAQASSSSSATSARTIAEELSDPLATQISVQLENNLEWNGGPANDGFRYTLTLQPILPFALDERWNVISRSSIPFVHQHDLVAAADARPTGLASSSESLFLSPSHAPYGVTWGVGPIVAFPATSDQLGPTSIELGPTGAVIVATGPMTFGILTHQIWSVDDRARELWLQPEVAWSGESGTSVRVSSESSYAWNAGQWTIPVIATVAQVVHIANQPFELELGPIVYLDRPDNSPRWGVRASITLVIPRAL